MIRIFWIVFTFIKQYYKFRDSNIPMGEIFMNIFLFTAQTPVVWRVRVAATRVKIHLSVKLWKCPSHCSSIRNKITTFPNQISKSSFSSWCWMTFTAVTVLVGRVLYWLHGPVLMHSNCSVIFPIAKVIIITIQDRKCVKNVFPLATFPRVYSFALRLDRSNVIITVSAYRGAGPRALTTNSCTKFQLNIFPERDSA